jgi:protocatechuate 3,4-dioxygenase beta subunit
MTTISGRVVDASGRGVAGARVMVAAAPGNVPDVALLTGADGRFTLSAPVPGRYTIAAATDAGAAEREVSVAAVAVEDIQLRLDG